MGGRFTMAGGVATTNIAKWNGSAWSSLGSGVATMDEGDAFSLSVSALAVAGTDLYVAGYFTNAGGVGANHIAKWNGNAWSALGSGLGGRGGSVVGGPVAAALAVLGPDLYVGGYFTSAGGKGASYLARANISPPSVPVIRNIGRAGTNVVVRGTNGPAGAAYYVLAGTNVAQPRANWARLATNRFDATGSFTFTNGITPSALRRFYSLQVP